MTAIPPLTDEHVLTLRRYSELMQEIVVRGEFMTASIDYRASNLPPGIALEFIYFQLRMICEVIALGCLLAHRDIAETGELRRQWRPRPIIDRLAALHPDFYPRPSRRVFNGDGELTGFEVRTDDGYATKKQLLEIHGRCGNYLHRGTFHRIINEKSAGAEIANAKRHADLIGNLLNAHQILLSDERHVMYTDMFDQETKNVRTWIYRANPKSPSI